MCLYELDKKPKKITKGYKVYKKWQGKYEGTHQGGSYPKNKWITSSNVTLYTDLSLEPYPSGFHVFTNKKDAHYWNSVSRRETKILEVEIDPSSITASGKQSYFCKDNMNVIVAKRIRILREVN